MSINDNRMALGSKMQFPERKHCILFLAMIFLAAKPVMAGPLLLQDAANFYDLTPHLEFFEDQSKKLDIETVSSSAYLSKFSRARVRPLPVPKPHSVYWIRLELKNNTTKRRTWWLVQKYVWQHHIDLYEPRATDDGSSAKWKMTRNGSMLPFDERPIKNRYFVFPLTPGKDRPTIYYLRLTSLTNFLRVQLHTPEHFSRVNQEENIVDWLFFGIVFVMFIYNALVGYVLRDRSFLYYILYLSLLGAYALIDKGYALEYVWPNSPIWNSRSDLFFSAWSTLFLVFFANSFLQLRRFAPRLRLFIIGWICLSLSANMLYTIFFNNLFLELSRYLYMVGIPLFLSAAAISFRSGFRPARFFLYGYSFFFLAVLINVLRTLSILPELQIWDWSVQSGTALEIMFFSFGLASKINRLQIDKDKANTELLESQSRQIEYLRHVNRMKDEFLANTSHELRTPLQGMIGLTESLRAGIAGNLPEEANRQLLLIGSGARRLANLLNDILDSSRLKHKDIVLNKKKLDVGQAVAVVLELSEPRTNSKNIDLRMDIATELPLVWADEDRLQQILHNLVGNAVKFTPSGFVEVSAEKINSGFLEVHVTDSGPGIPENHQESIFESYEQVDGGAERAHGGVGLGLSISRALVELHGGRLRVESPSANGGGSRFIFSLPIAKESAPADDGESVADESESHASTMSDCSNKQNGIRHLPDGPRSVQTERGDEVGQAAVRILCVDDEIVNLQVLSNYIVLQNWEALTASSGEEALEILGRDTNIHVVVLDLMMPRMSGFEVVRHIREQYGMLELPVLMLTARNRNEDLLAGLQAGVNDYLVKPVTRDAAMLRISNLVNLRGAHQESRNTRETISKAVRIERREFNRNLHDHIGAQLLDLTFLSNKIGESMSHEPELGSRLVDLVRQTTGMLREQMLFNEDLNLLAEDFFDGINLILLRRYAGANRELDFRGEPGLSSLREQLSRETRAGLYVIFKEIATNDLKYGFGMTTWSVNLNSESGQVKKDGTPANSEILIQITAQSRYRLEENGIGLGTRNITTRAAELGGLVDVQLNEGRFSLTLTLPLGDIAGPA